MICVLRLARGDELPTDTPHAAIGLVSSSTWSRARHRSNSGPQPVRNANWRWGLPWLKHGEREAVEEANDELCHIASVLSAALKRSPVVQVALLAPEDLGRALGGRPASVWQLAELRKWAHTNTLQRAAFYQCEFGRTSRPRPTGVLLTHKVSDKRLKPGWPRFCSPGNDVYLGPLEPHCKCGQDHANAIHECGSDKPLLVERSVLQNLLPILWEMDGTVKPAELLRIGNGKVGELESDVESDSTWFEDIADFDSGHHIEEIETESTIQGTVSMHRRLLQALDLHRPAAEASGGCYDTKANHEEVGDIIGDEELNFEEDGGIGYGKELEFEGGAGIGHGKDMDTFERDGHDRVVKTKRGYRASLFGRAHHLSAGWWLVLLLSVVQVPIHTGGANLRRLSEQRVYLGSQLPSGRSVSISAGLSGCTIIRRGSGVALGGNSGLPSASIPRVLSQPYEGTADKEGACRQACRVSKWPFSSLRVVTMLRTVAGWVTAFFPLAPTASSSKARLEGKVRGASHAHTEGKGAHVQIET